MNPQQPSFASHPEQHSALVSSAFTKQQWEEAAMARIRAEIDGMDATAATTAIATAEDNFVMIDGLLYVKAWLVSEETETTDAKTRTQN
jgi:endonuclease V-like protein UPF0215 family